MGGPPPDDTMLRSLQQWGAPADVIASTRDWLHQQAKAATVPVWPEHWHAVQLFLRLRTQWHWVSVGHEARRTGLRYESATPALLQAVADSIAPSQVQPPAVLWAHLQTLESAALEAWAKG